MLRFPQMCHNLGNLCGSEAAVGRVVAHLLKAGMEWFAHNDPVLECAPRTLGSEVRIVEKGQFGAAIAAYLE